MANPPVRDSASPRPGDAILEASDITKVYGNAAALLNVSLAVARGQVTTVFGENGAGKSTLMKILSGVIRPTFGEVRLDGEAVALNSPLDARDLGIAIVHQELSLCPNLTVRDNMFLGREKRSAAGAVRYQEQEDRARKILRGLDASIDPLALVGDLRVGQQQVVEIARALSENARLIIMDEPTSALSAAEVATLFRVIADLKRDGVSIVYISHHLEEAMSVSDWVVVLRDGRVAARAQASRVNLEWVVQKMVGTHSNFGAPPARDENAPVQLQLRDVVVASPSDVERPAVNGISLDVRGGEIVCLYGLMGAGRTELLEAVAGKVRVSSGCVRLREADVVDGTIRERIDAGVGLVPEDRQRDGLVQTMDVTRNITLSSLESITRSGFLSKRSERKRASAAIEQLHVKTPSPTALVGELSGGNQQKVVIARALATRPSVLLLDEPTRGIDVGAKGEIYRLLARLAEDGLAVVYATSELDECFTIPHRILVLRKGRIAAEFTPDAGRHQIMAAAGEHVADTDMMGGYQ